MKQPNHRQSCDGVEAGPSTETGCGSKTSLGCSSALWFKLSERARIPFLDCHFKLQTCRSLMLPLAGSAPCSWLTVAGFQAGITDIWGRSPFHRGNPHVSVLNTLTRGHTDLLDFLDQGSALAVEQLLLLFFVKLHNQEELLRTAALQVSGFAR